MMNDLINNLKKFAIDDFPIKTVSKFISQYNFSAKELDSYCFYKKINIVAISFIKKKISKY